MAEELQYPRRLDRLIPGCRAAQNGVLGLCYNGHAQCSSNGPSLTAAEGIAIVPERERGPNL
ncbi:MAG: hypothetical protein QOG67_1115 [Verrucomicrobiota bacterium]|jgi:hypothetical protein